jgi:hypothetical protein
MSSSNGNPQSVEYYTEDMAIQGGAYSEGHYKARNKAFAPMILGAHPKEVIEVACAEGALARTILGMDQAIVHYDLSDFCPAAVELAKKNNPDPRANAFVLDIDTEYDRVKWEFYDTFISTSLEHIVHDREIIASLVSGTTVALCLPNFDCEGHVRFFDSCPQAMARYEDLVDWVVSMDFPVVTTAMKVHHVADQFGFIGAYARLGRSLQLDVRRRGPQMKYLMVGKRK